MYTNMLSNVQNFDVISENVYKIQSWWRHHNFLHRYLLSINDWSIWTHVLSELKNWNIEGAIWNKVQILQDAPTEPSPHTSLLYIPPLWRASRKTSQFQIKTILLANTFHLHWYAQGFAPDQYGPSVLHKRPFCNAFSGCGSGKRFFPLREYRVSQKTWQSWVYLCNVFVWVGGGGGAGALPRPLPKIIIEEMKLAILGSPIQR